MWESCVLFKNYSNESDEIYKNHVEYKEKF